MSDRLVERIQSQKKNTRHADNKFAQKKYVPIERGFNGHSISDKTPRTYGELEKRFSIGHIYR
ncbi:MAG: hypothetical protein IJI20_05885 [Firmicutes bacterium]|nr:hypothetical protein [Bacillota bacterium]